MFIISHFYESSRVQKVIYLFGPTASGKSDLTIALTKKIVNLFSHSFCINIPILDIAQAEGRGVYAFYINSFDGTVDNIQI